jgi:hypothetical protein
LAFQPGLTLLMLALWTMSITAGVILIVGGLAMVTVVHMTTQINRSTHSNVPHSPLMAGQEFLAESFFIGRSIFLNNRSQCAQDRAAIISLICSIAEPEAPCVI